MSGFIYYIPRAKGFVEDDAKRLDLEHLGKSLTKAAVAAGPDGTGGLLLVVTGNGQASALFKADEQEWHKQKGGKFWIGWWKDDPPVPDDLLLNDSAIGSPMMLGKLVWTIPRQAALPAYMGLDDMGLWEKKIEGPYLALQEDAELVYQIYLGQSGKIDPAPTIEISEECDLCVRALAINYRVSRFELAALGVLTVDNRALIMLALMDLRFDAENTVEAFDEAEESKKKELSDCG